MCPKIDKGKNTGRGGQQRHGDFGVALAMAVRASWMEGAPSSSPLPGKRDSERNDDYHRSLREGSGNDRTHRHSWQPLRLQKEPQTENDAKLAQLRRHYSEHPTVGSPGKAAAALKEAEEGASSPSASWPEDMEEKDAHLQSEFGKRRRSLLGVSWTIEPPRNATPPSSATAR